MGFEGKIALSRYDPGVWGLNRKGHVDAGRHQERVTDAVRRQKHHIVTAEPAKTPFGEVIAVPIPSVDLPRFRFDYGRNRHIGQGKGGSRPGERAGDLPGSGLMDSAVQVPVADAEKIVFEGWELPGLRPKTARRIQAEQVVYDDIRRKGPMSTLDRKRTVLANMARNARQKGKAKFEGIQTDDLRFRASSVVPSVETNAVIIAMRDISGSMADFEKFAAKKFYRWMEAFLKTKYPGVITVFVTHDVRAQVVDNDTFFKKDGFDGGTKVSSAYQLATDIIKTKYNPSDWNVYPFHFSDGDNLDEADNKLCAQMVKQMLDQGVNMFGYADIRKRGTPSELSATLRAMQHPNFKGVFMRQQRDIYGALRSFFSQNRKREGVAGRA